MKIKYKKVKTLGEFIDIIRLRVEVFEIEQKCRPGLEPDENDKVAVQYIAIVDNKIMSTARFRQPSKGEFKIGRMATKKEYRGKGISSGILDYMLKDIKKLKPKKIWLQSQVQAQKFYEKHNFKSISKPYDWDGIPHI
ncbi:GNAT family N-acetyltransferase [Candidatus Woesearchaeota archaeon]|nr:GNAT family N-acetyltransferase [Candidatus Woesearchaeota archaeon]